MNRQPPYRSARSAPRSAQNWQSEDAQSPYAADGDFDAVLPQAAQRNAYPRAEDLRSYRGVQRGAYGRYDEDDWLPREQHWGYGDYAAERGTAGVSRRDFGAQAPYAHDDVQRGDYRSHYGQERGHGGAGGYHGRGVEGAHAHGGYAEQHSGQRGAGAYGRPRGQPGENFAGRGPKDYRRSDERLTEDVNERLTADPYIDASEISVSVKNGVVTLTGNVPQRPLRYHAEDLVESCTGVRDIDNQLRVAGRRSD